MADKAFALSPISARATQPGEDDYAAISEAFMETSRGRWFLGEYAKRNRNADTRMVLDAVARIEQSLAAQKAETHAAQQQADAGRAEARLAEARLADAKLVESRLAEAKLTEAKLTEARLAEARLAEARLEARLAEARQAEGRLTEQLTAIRGAIVAAQASAAEALDALALEQKLAPVRKGARVIREIAWRLREIGNDGRICDLIDSQVAVIEAGVGELSAEEAKAALRAAFASIEARLAEFDDDLAPAQVSEAPAFKAPAFEAAAAEAPIAETAVAEAAASEFAVFEAPIASPAPTASEAAAVAVIETIEAAPVQEAPETPASSLAPAAEVALADADAKAALAEAEAAETAAVTDEAADAHDEAVLDLIAQEMGAPDAFDIDDPATANDDEVDIVEPMPAEPEYAAAMPGPIVAEPPEPIAEAVEPPAELPYLATIETSPPTAAESAPEPDLEDSLGSSLLASGIVRKPGIAANDPLAPIRRMSQAEKIAFFS